MRHKINNINIESISPIITPQALKEKLPLTDQARKIVAQSRRVIKNILSYQDHRLFVVVGPCSVHDVKAALDYASRLRALADQVQDTLFLIMRVYFEKPRTTVGWKGLVNDPYLDDSLKSKRAYTLLGSCFLTLCIWEYQLLLRL